MLGSQNNLSMTAFRKFLALVVAVSLVDLLAGWSQTAPAPAKPSAPAQHSAPDVTKMAPTGLAANGGSIANDVYTNSTYGFSWKVPPGWVVVPSKNPVAPSPNSREAGLMQAAQVNHVLLVMTENAPMKKSTQRKSLQIVATRLLKEPTPKEGQDYLVYSKRTARERNMPVEYLGDPTEVTINGRKLWTIALNQTTDGATQHVEQYVTTQGSVLLQFMLVSPDEAGLKDLEPSLQSLEMKGAAKKSTPASAARKKKPTPSAQ